MLSILTSIPKPLYHWQPSFWRHGYNCNFGDIAFSLIVNSIVGHAVRTVPYIYPFPRLLAGGSILQFARRYDTLWGIGMRSSPFIPPSRLDVRAVRGPLTRKYLLKHDIHCPEIYGDPVLLLPYLFPQWVPSPVKNRIGIVPHHRNYAKYLNHKLGTDMVLISPIQHPIPTILAILSCERIIASSLHGIIVADAYKIPARWLVDASLEPEIKYHDYYEGTNRTANPALSLAQADALGGERLLSGFDAQNLLDAFPNDIDLAFQISR